MLLVIFFCAHMMHNDEMNPVCGVLQWQLELRIFQKFPETLAKAWKL